MVLFRIQHLQQTARRDRPGNRCRPCRSRPGSLPGWMILLSAAIAVFCRALRRYMSCDGPDLAFVMQPTRLIRTYFRRSHWRCSCPAKSCRYPEGRRNKGSGSSYPPLASARPGIPEFALSPFHPIMILVQYLFCFLQIIRYPPCEFIPGQIPALGPDDCRRRNNPACWDACVPAFRCPF